jgi:aspartate kinase
MTATDSALSSSAQAQHTVEKIGGTSMSDYQATRKNIYLNPGLNGKLYQRIFVVSAYGGITNDLLEHKKSGQSGVYALFASAEEQGSWQEAFAELRQKMTDINASFFNDQSELLEANSFINGRLDDAERVLVDLQRLCQHGHFSMNDHLQTVREMLASLGEIHSAYNTAKLLRLDGVAARFVDLSGWSGDKHYSIDEQITRAFANIDLSKELPITTGYCHSENGLMATYDRGYSEITFSRVAVLTKAREAIIHKEFHLSTADPRLVGEGNAIPIGRTNYDVADQLANLGMEAIHPNAAKGLRQQNILLRMKNTFEPEHGGTTITTDYVSDKPCVEIIAGRKGIYALELFDQDMVGNMLAYGQEFLKLIARFKAHVVNKDLNANTITYYLASNMKTIQRIQDELKLSYPSSETLVTKVCVVSAIGSHMKVPGILAQTTQALADINISVLAMHQSMRQVDMQFILDEVDYDAAVKSLHKQLVEVHDHGRAIRMPH